MPLAGDDDSEWVADHHAPDRAPLQAEHEHAADADVVVIDIASERQLPGAPASRARRHRQPQVVSYIDHDDERDDDQLSKWCAVEDAMWERVQEATERRRREKNWLERD